jgi:mercuric ion transport protein
MERQQENQPGNKTSSASTVFASLGALGSAIVASSCCLPLFPFLFAAGAAGASAFVGNVRPYLLLLSLLLIAFAVYKSWRAKQCGCKPSTLSIILLWFSAIVVFAFILFPQMIANFLANILAGRS